jgi:hypothetical protein
MQPMQSVQPMQPKQPRHRVQPRQARHARHPRIARHSKVSTLPAIPRLPPVATEPATAMLPAVATEPATAMLPAVAIEPATPMLPAVAIEPATAMLLVVAIEPATPMLSDVAIDPAEAMRSSLVSVVTATACHRDRPPACEAFTSCDPYSGPGMLWRTGLSAVRTGVASRHAVVGCVVAVLALLIGACDPNPADRQADVNRLTQQLRTMPGVEAASNEVADSTAQGLVYVRVYVDVADDITADQLAAITSQYLQNLRAVDYTGYKVELDARRGWSVFAVDSGELPITNGDQIVAQGRDWVALRHAFPGSSIGLRATIRHPKGQLPIQEWGHSNVATIALPDAADYTAVTGAVNTLATTFPQLGALDWTISAGKRHPAQIQTSRRLPNPHEIDVWNKLNADQSVPHVDKLTINGQAVPPVWLSEKTTQSHDVDVALQLARQHLPIAATLPPPVLYTASDSLSGHIGASGHSRGPFAVTIGGCTIRELWLYRPTPPEQALINTYEKCKR